jgi:long-subunit acyl-CoA synthetase (AMP-forming)
MNTDKLVEADSLYSTCTSKAVQLRATDDDLAEYPPRSIYSVFEETVNKNPNHNALMTKIDGKWESVSYWQYFQNCRDTAKSLIKVGFEKNDCVSIIGFNAAEWNYSCLGAMFAGYY